MNVWFGESWGAPVNETSPQVATPVGQACAHCEEVFVAGDQGFGMPVIGATATFRFLHLECHCRVIFGSVGHLRRKCACFGGTEEDPPGLSTREAARAAYVLLALQTPTRTVH